MFSKLDIGNKEDILQVLITGFLGGVVEFSDDGSVITSTAPDGRVMVKTFTNNFLTLTNVLTDANNQEVARMVTTFAQNGKTITSVVTYS